MATDMVVPNIIMQKHLLPHISVHSCEMRDLKFDMVKSSYSFSEPILIPTLVQLQEHVYTMTLPVSVLTLLLLRVTEAFLNAATLNTSCDISFQIGDRDMVNFCDTFMLEFSHFNLGLSVFQPPVY